MRYVRKMYLLLFIFVLLLPLREAAVAIALNATHPDHKGKCYEKGPPPTILNIGEAKRHPTSCNEIYCDSNFSLHFRGCGAKTAYPHCWTIDGDPSKPYPFCCPEVIC